MGRNFDLQAAVVGGDTRQIAVAKALTGLFNTVKIFGHPPSDVPDPIKNCWDLKETLENARVVVLPISGMNDAGLVRGYNLDHYIDFGSCISSLAGGTLILTGSLTDKWIKLADSLQIKVFQYAEEDEIAILNSVPTAEGAVQIAMEELPITIHGSIVIVLGFGRVGTTVARIFKALGAKVIASARRPSVLARAWEMGCEKVLTSALPGIIQNANLIINTIPAMVINETLLQKVSKEALIIDLASPPGGTDFEAAKKLNIKAILAPGLPGKVAPVTSGLILSSAIPKLIEQILNGGGDH